MAGKWYMVKVIEYGQDVTTKHNPNQNRWIEFKSDSIFKSDGDPFGPNDGRWSTENKKAILRLNSNTEDDDSEWKVVVGHDQMTWTGIGHERKVNTQIVYRKDE